MEFYVHKDFVGYGFHILCSTEHDKLIFKDKIEDNVYVFGDINKELYSYNLNEVFYLNGGNVNIIEFPELKYKKSIELVIANKNNIIPWCNIIPRKQYVQAVKNLVAQIKQLINQCNFEYYENINKKTEYIINSLQQQIVHEDLLNELLNNEENITNKQILTQFKNNNKTVYDRKTKTGRFRVIDGPDILRLKKEYRVILKSRFGEQGKLYYFDYKSLEPRTLLAVNNKHNIPKDIYQYVIDELILNNIKRDTIKNVVLSQIFGASDETIITELNKEKIENPNQFIRLINNFFEIDTCKQKLIIELRNNNNKGLYNFYGRWIDCIDSHPYMLVNRYIQSTAVDVSVIGFNNILNYINNNNELKNNIIPLFVLHDAILMDVNTNNITEDMLNNIISVGEEILNFNSTKFFIEYSVI